MDITTTTRKPRRKAARMLSTAAAADALALSVAQFRAITDRLGVDADGTYTNPHYRSGPPALLWSTTTLTALKRRRAFREYLSGAEKRRDAARQAVAAKRTAILDAIEAAQINVRHLDWDALVRAAIDNFNSRTTGDRATITSDPQFIERICVNYVRHCLTSYDDTLDGLVGRVGRDGRVCAMAQPDLQRDRRDVPRTRRGVRPPGAGAPHVPLIDGEDEGGHP